MKRILFLVTVALLGLASTAWAHRRCYYSRLGHIRNSPYAFRFGHNGLVPDSLRHSPYANGLVHESMRYSPYAFSMHHNGLIPSWAGYYSPVMGWVHPYDLALRHELASAINRLSASVEDLRARQYGVAVRNINQVRYAQSPVQVKPSKDPGQTDQYRLVRDHLRQTMPGQYRISRLLRIDGEIVSFDVVLENCNTVIKYWNAEKFKALRAQADNTQKVLDRYLQRWARFGNEHEMKGGSIYHISSNDSGQLIAKLNTYTDMKPAYMVAKR